MRKVKLQVQISVDGYIAGPNQEMDWMVWNWDDELKKFVGQLTDSCDCMLLGRNLASGFIPHWIGVAENAEHPEHAFGKLMTDMPKLVFSKSLTKTDPVVQTWPNTNLVTENLVDEIKKLKQTEGKDIIVYGGASFVSSLIENNLIDEINLFVNPAALGEGMKIFSGRTPLKLEKSIPFSCGIIMLTYSPAKS